ncbi:MAG: 5-deoxy-glucuronate isomerase [Acidimicrobiia bacterium]|nr:5-deoxy-glucuronate isomerase [Acidimicrobiia bacterium]
MTIKAKPGPGTVLQVTPESAGWSSLSFAVVELVAGQSHRHLVPDQETAVVPLSGTASLELGSDRFEVARRSVFAELAPVGYAPPGTPVTLTAGSHGCTFAIGGAPAEGRYPARLIEPSIIRSEVRGGGAALRQVNHTLAPPVEAERLILYEVYVPRGTWSGWAPHRHDGIDGSPYLEETYYFRLDRPEGFWMHRNWDDGTGYDGDGADRPEPYEQLMSGGDGDCALVPGGYHSSVACPGANMYFLNYLAGELVAERRATPPCFHSDFTWIESDWGQGAWNLPVVDPAARSDVPATGGRS